MDHIFLSYRRKDSGPFAAMLKDTLERHFGPNSIFIDVDDIRSGVDFRKQIEKSVAQCDVLLIIIGDNWLQSLNDQGNRRIDDPSDYVRIEIESALKNGKPIIPVLVDEVKIPSENDLPSSISSIVFLNAAVIDTGRDRHQHMERLIRDLEDMLKRKPRANDSKQPVIADENDRSEILKEVQETLKGFTDKHLFLGKTIPPKKIYHAISTYAPQVSPQDVLLLYDNTRFRGAKDGLLLTADAIYWRNSKKSEPEQLSFTEIRKVDFLKVSFYKSILLLNQKEIVLDAGDHDKLAESLTNVIRHLKTR